MSVETMLPAWAVWYAVRGVPVFPLQPGTKEPYPRTRGFKDATVDIARVIRIWRIAPQSNIGAACGHMFDVLDIDVKIAMDGTVHKDARPSMHRLNTHGLLGGAIGSARTRHDGVHLYYPPSGLNRSRLNTLHVDFQGAGSYVVMPPSIVPADSGIAGAGAYTWIDQLDVTRSGKPADWAAIRELLRPAPDPFTQCLADAGDSFRHANARIEHLTNWLARQSHGNRNHALFWAASRAVEDGLDPDGLRATAEQLGLPGREIAKTIASARRASKGRTA